MVSYEATRRQALPSPPGSSALCRKNGGVYSLLSAGPYREWPVTLTVTTGRTARVQCRDPFFLRKKTDATIRTKMCGGRVSQSASVRGLWGNSRSLLTNADDVQGVNEKYTGEALCFWIWKRKKNWGEKKERCTALLISPQSLWPISPSFPWSHSWNEKLIENNQVLPPGYPFGLPCTMGWDKWIGLWSPSAWCRKQSSLSPGCCKDVQRDWSNLFSWKDGLWLQVVGKRMLSWHTRLKQTKEEG